jgi:hypothetical protein
MGHIGVVWGLVLASQDLRHIGVVWGLVLASQDMLAMENEEECFAATNYGDSLSRSILFLKGNVLGNCLPTRE